MAHRNARTCPEEEKEEYLTRAEKRKDFMYVTWRINREDDGGGVRFGLEIALINKDYDFHGLKVQLARRKLVDVTERNLAEFYQQLPVASRDTQLGPYYLSYFEKACAQLGMPFDSKVSRIGSENLTVVTIMLNLN